MSYHKRLLLVATRQFWPIANGRSYTLFHYCRILHERYGYEVNVVCFVDKSTQKDVKKPSFINDVLYAENHGLKHSWKKILVKSFVMRKWPIQTSMMYDRNTNNMIIEYAEKIQPAIILIDMIRLLPYMDGLKQLQAKKIFLEDDLLEKRYKRQLQANESESLAGNYAVNMTSFENKIINIKWIRSLILRMEISLLNRYEKHGLELSDYVCFVSPIETNEYNERFKTSKGITLVVGTEKISQDKLNGIEKEPCSMVMVGDFRNEANIASIKWIAQRIIPLLPNEIKLYLIGHIPDYLLTMIKSNQIKALGYVDDLFRTVLSTEVYFAPLAFGTGIKTKIIEAMAMGMPVVTNSIGAEGLAVQSGKELFIADDPQELANIAIRLLNDPKLREEVGLQGQKYVRSNHDWEIIYSAFDRMGF